MNKFMDNCKWIWKNDRVEVNQFAYFRKELKIGKGIRAAKIMVSAHNHFELYINGFNVSGYVTPAPTHPVKSKYYLCYDIAAHLISGSNVLGAIVHYLGGGGQNYMDGLPGFILQCEIVYEDGTLESMVTDESWKTLGETPFRNGTEYQQNRKMSVIEDYDACKEDGWLTSGYDDNHWRKAVLSPINKENWVLKLQPIPEGKVHEVIVPKPVGVQEKGMQVFDAGKIITGWPRLEIEGVPGVQLMMRYSEDLTPEGRVKHNVCNEKSENYCDIYRMKGASVESWEPCLSYKAFRYVEVTGYTEMLKPENMKVISAGTGLSYRGFFNCSDSLLNDIYKACIQTQKNNVVGQMVDCPHREQAQYLADSDLQAETFIYNFYNQEVLKKVLLDFKDGQFEDGRFQFVFPSNINPQFDIKIPEWDLHFTTLLWKIYFYYGDTDFLRYCYGSAKKAVEYYLGARDKSNGLLPKGKGFPEAWNISDWPYPNIDDSGSALTVGNCLLYHVSCLLSKMAGILGFENDVEFFEGAAHDLKKNIVKYLYNPQQKLFADSLGSEQHHQGTNVVAYQYGLVPKEDREEVLQFIVSEGFGCSTLLSLNLLQVLFENGRGDEAYKLLGRTDYPGWGYMIRLGFKTIWEGFQNIESHSHAWNAYPARILIEYVVGIKAAAPGFSVIEIKPFFPENLAFAEGKVPTATGDIAVNWEKGNGKLTLKANIPMGSKVRVFIPKSYGRVLEAGRTIWENEKSFRQEYIEFIEEALDCIIFEAGSGQYSFEAEI